MSQGDLENLLKKMKIADKVKKSLEDREFEREMDRETFLRHTEMILTVNIERKGCYKAEHLLAAHDMDGNISKSDFLRLGPALIHEIEAGTCWRKEDDGDSDVPTDLEKWGFGFLSITIISFASLALIVIIPFIPKHAYARVMSYLVALAVGTLSG